MEFLLRPIIGLERTCSARDCSEKAVYKVLSVRYGDGWDSYYYAGVMCEEHAKTLEAIFPTKREALSKVEYK